MYSERDLTEMSYNEFQELIDNFIERSSHQTAEMSTSTFFELLYENSKKRVQETIPLSLSIKGGEVELNLPQDREATILTYNNEIFVGDTLFVVTLQNGNQQGSPSQASSLLTSQAVAQTA